MKFGKEFVSQMVPEWQEAYMNYSFLKGLLKAVLRFRQQNMTAAAMAATPRASLRRRVSLYRAFSGLTSRNIGSPKKNGEDEAILVSAVQGGEGSEGYYQTLFLMSSDEGGEYEVVYFRRLDEEFNKVVKFYEGKVEEVMKEAEELNKQMDALIALRIKVENPLVGFGGGGGGGGGGSGLSERRLNHQDDGGKPGKREIVRSDFILVTEILIDGTGKI